MNPIRDMPAPPRLRREESVCVRQQDAPMPERAPARTRGWGYVTWDLSLVRPKIAKDTKGIPRVSRACEAALRRTRLKTARPRDPARHSSPRRLGAWPLRSRTGLHRVLRPRCD